MYVNITQAESDVSASRIAKILQDAGYFVELVEINDGHDDRWTVS
jgi:hypothetical protein